MDDITKVRLALGIQTGECSNCRWAENEQGDGCNYRSKSIRDVTEAIDKCLLGRLTVDYALWEPRPPEWKPGLRRWRR